jgi:predicted nucleic acid-binding protein
MKLVLVDTSVWSLVLRRRIPGVNNKREQSAIDHLVHGILSQCLATSTTVIRELTEGTSPALRALIEHALRGFPVLPVTTAIQQRAWSIWTLCRSRGVQIGQSDCEIIATAEAAGCLVLSLDRDFEHARRVLGSEFLLVLDR